MRDYVAAVIELLEDHVDAEGLTLPIYNGEVPTGKDEPTIYVVVYNTSPAHESQRLSADNALRVYTVTTMTRGSTPNEARWAQEVIEAAMTRQRLTVGGRATGPITKLTAGQVRPDDKVNPSVWTCSDVWRFTAPA